MPKVAARRLTCTGVDNAFTGAALDRAGDSRRRDQAWLDAQREHPGARAVVAGDRGFRIAGGHLEFVPLAQLNGAEPLFLGLDEHGPLFAVDEDPVREGRVPMVGSGGVRGEAVEASARAAADGEDACPCARRPRSSPRPRAGSSPTPPRC